MSGTWKRTTESSKMYSRKADMPAVWLFMQSCSVPTCHVYSCVWNCRTAGTQLVAHVTFLATWSHNVAGWNLTQWLLYVRRHNRNASKQANCTNNLKWHKIRANWLAIVMLRNKGKCFSVPFVALLLGDRRHFVGHSDRQEISPFGKSLTQKR